jgi:hypothetical protein
MRVNMPPIKKWQTNDILTRDPDSFLRDVALFAAAANQEAWRALTAHVDDGFFRDGLERCMLRIVSEKGHVSDADMRQAFKQLAGQHLVSVEERYTEQLINSALAQKPDESVAQYGLRARVYKERLSQLPESVMCK